jgi:hypothetical protein
MTAHFSLIDKIKIYEDTSSTDNPKKVLINYQEEITKDFTQYNRQDITIPALSNLTVTLPAACSFLYVLTDNSLALRFNGEVDDNCTVSPSVAATKDGIFIKRGAFASLIIRNLSANTANVTYFAGV